MIKRRVEEFYCTEDQPVVATKAGRLHGCRVNGVYSFKGVPYAQARRFHLPEPAEPWTGVRDALAYGPGCPEMTWSIRGRAEMDQPEVPGRIWSVSEDCQNLNVWTRSLEPGAKRPVMVWLHGGGFAGGASTHLYSYDGFELAERYDVVLVSVNHRLNMLGFFDLSEYGECYAHSANAGMADLVLALQWVRDNIALFGGDPDNVTILGQSGGGGKVCTLMQMPAADGLYHRAIIQSGVFRDHFMEQRRGLTDAVVKALGLTRETIGRIETMDMETVAAAVRAEADRMGVGMMQLWGPTPEPGFYEGNPLAVGFRPETRRIPIIAGSCVAEFDDRVPAGDKARWTDEARMAQLVSAYGDRAGAAREAFEAAYPGLDWCYAAIADNMIRPATLELLARRAAEAEAPCYNYVFAFESRLKGGKLLGHNSDLHFMFHNAGFMPAMCVPGVTGPLQDAMAGAWTRFAETGDPNGPGLPAWEPCTPAGGECLKLGARISMEHGHDRELMALLAEFPEKHFEG